jgi:hypothetical protein
VKVVLDQRVLWVVVLAKCLVVGENCPMTTTAAADQLFAAEETGPARSVTVPAGRQRTFRT